MARIERFIHRNIPVILKDCPRFAYLYVAKPPAFPTVNFKAIRLEFRKHYSLQMVIENDVDTASFPQPVLQQYITEADKIRKLCFSLAYP
jgi:hypothetical protein